MVCEDPCEDPCEDGLFENKEGVFKDVGEVVERPEFLRDLFRSRSRKGMLDETFVFECVEEEEAHGLSPKIKGILKSRQMI